MSRDGSITFGDLIGKLDVLRVICDKCGRAAKAVPGRFESAGIPKELRMSESACIDSLVRGLAMPKSYSGDMRERVIESVEMGASRREAAEHIGVSASSAVRWL